MPGAQHPLMAGLNLVAAAAQPSTLMPATIVVSAALSSAGVPHSPANYALAARGGGGNALAQGSPASQQGHAAVATAAGAASGRKIVRPRIAVPTGSAATMAGSSMLDEVDCDLLETAKRMRGNDAAAVGAAGATPAASAVMP